jgi:hypothetical protein
VKSPKEPNTQLIDLIARIEVKKYLEEIAEKQKADEGINAWAVTRAMREGKVRHLGNAKTKRRK